MKLDWKALLFALLQATIRWLTDELAEETKDALRKRERLIFPGDEKFRAAGEAVEE